MENTIRVERARKRISQKELADEVKVTRQTINGVENNKQEPTLTLAMKIARFFKLKIEDIFQITEED